MVLRILVPDKHSTVPLGEKFGVPPDQIVPLAELAADLGLPVAGISFHCGSGNHDPDAYKVAVRMALDAAREVEQVREGRRLAQGGEEEGGGDEEEGSLPRRCWLIDIGGGFPGRDGCGADSGRFVGDGGGNGSAARDPGAEKGEEEEEETALKISEAVVPLLEELFPIGRGESGEGNGDFQFIAEPGRYFVEAAFALCSRIYRVKVEALPDGSEHRHYYIDQGVQGVFKDCILCGESFLPVPLRVEEGGGGGQGGGGPDPVPCTVHGPSGLPDDVVCRDRPLPPLGVGDWLVFDRMGAYTLSIAARSGRPAVRYVLGGSRLPAPPRGGA
jgi:ornithine decarboxylase